MSKDDKKSSESFRRTEELLGYLEKGKVFTEELMKENERLRMLVLRLEKEKMELQSRTDPQNLDKLFDENRELRERLDALASRFYETEKENQDFAQRYVEVQNQNDNLLNLYVSSYQLHSTLNPGEVVKVIEEIILNLIGAEQYFVCMIDDKKKSSIILAGEGPEGPIRGQSLRKADPILMSVLRKGEAYFRGEGEADSPHLACTPLKVKDDVVGAISIMKLLDQKKEGLTTIDYELLSLLSDHAATALVSSNLYNRTERKLRTVEGFIKLLKMDGAKGVSP